MAISLKRVLATSVVLAACVWFASAQVQRATPPNNTARIWELRNLGKAFYENPTMQKEAVAQFRQALALAPASARERVNYALALLRAGDTAQGMAELEKVQKQDPKLPHSWFNLGIAYKRQGDVQRAEAQFLEMVKLVPEDAVSHYQLGALYASSDDLDAALSHLEAARRLHPQLAAPHFQLYNVYRRMQLPQEAATSLATFQRLKDQQQGAAIPEDMEWGFYSEIYDPVDGPRSPPAPVPIWRSQKLGTSFTGVVAIPVVTGRPSAIAWSASKIAVFNSLRIAVPSGIETLTDTVSIAPGDYDNDGRADLCIINKTGAALYRNIAGRYSKAADLATGSFRKALWVDFDHDYDPDLFLFGDDSRLLRNNGTAGFSDESARFPFQSARALDAVNFEIEPDTQGFDIVVSYQDRPGVLYKDQLGGSYSALALDIIAMGSTHLEVSDMTQDSRMEVRPVDAPLPARTGRLDQFHVDANGSLLASRNTAIDGNWLEVALEGVKTAKIPLNAKIEVKAGAIYRKAVYEGTPVSFRLGRATKVDTVRITWPNGLIQNETNKLVNQLLRVKEAPRLAGSCPMVFTWDGQKFQFITDVLGVAPLGASSGDGKYFPVDHDEYVSIPSEALRVRNGKLDVRVTEELREVTYLDHVRLFALDHDASVDVITNEKFKAPPFPEFRLYGSKMKIHPIGMPTLARRDRVYPDGFRRDFAGVAETHNLDLNFGKAAADNRAILMLNGWVDWADGSTFLAATQAKRDLIFPYLQVKDAAGNWKTVIEDMGIPAGKPKTIAVDLTGKFLSASREVRIVTSLCVYWDEIYLVEDTAAPVTTMTPVPLASAMLHYRGFSEVTVDPLRKQPDSFNYQNMRTPPWSQTPGSYTRYGAVDQLLSAIDDRLVVMGSGDEIALQFDPSTLPALPKGWRRDYLLLFDGWAKDADANTAFSQTVQPLPFHAMSQYPYPAKEIPPPNMNRDLTRPALRLVRPLVQ